MCKKWLTAALASAGMLALILDSRAAFLGAVQGVDLCIKTVIPSLFPFLFLSGIITASLQGTKLPFLRFLGKLFLLPPNMEHLLIPAFLGGYPIGAQCVFQACRSGLLSKSQAERMLAYCSNAGPAFIFGILTLKFQQKSLIWVIWGIQILSAWTAARFFSPCDFSESTKTAQKSERTVPAIEAAIQAMGKICGWVILFRVIIAFLDKWLLRAAAPQWRVTILGLLELSNGCCSLDRIPQEVPRFIICSFLLAFGGACVAYQTASVCPGLRMGFYYAGKLLQGASAVVLSMALYYRLWIVLPVWIAVVLLFTAGLQKRSRNPALLGV